MFLSAWWLTGVFLGWFIWASYRLWRPERPWEVFLSADQAGQLDPATRPLVESAIAILRANLPGQPQHDDGPAGLDRPSAIRAVLALVSMVAFALLVVSLAAATDHAELWQWLVVVKSYFTGVRVQALLVGIVSGIFLRQYRRPLGDFTLRLGNAVIGDKDSTAWALQSALAIGLIAIGIFAVRPDFLSYLRSFKLGTVEATFADQSLSSLREAHFNLREFRAKLFLSQFTSGFESVEESKFISKTEARSRSRRLLGENTERWTRRADAITKLLFDLYVGPVLSSVACLEQKHAVRTAIHDPDLSSYVSAWEDFLLQVHRDQSSLNKDQIASFLSALDERSAPFVARVRKLAPNCRKGVAEGAQSSQSAADARPGRTVHEDANDIHEHFEAAIPALKNYSEEDPRQLSLIIFEPYVTAAIGELISLVSGEKEKADFLQNLLHGFPLSEKLATAGVINLYYQVTDSQLNSIGSLPLDLMVDQIQYANRGAKNLMRESRKRLADKRLASGGIYSRKKIGERTLTEIYDRFLQNSFVTQRAEMDVYVQSVLDGETLSQKHRQNWMTATSRVLATLQQQSDLPRLEIDGLPRIELDRFEAERTRHAKFDEDFLLQANLSIALSAILLNDATRVSAQNCNTALFFVNQASLSIGPTVRANKLSWALENRLRQWVGAVANRVGESCNWSDARGQAKSDEPKK